MLNQMLEYPQGLDAGHQWSIRSQVKVLKWVLGEGGDVIVDKEAIARTEMAKKIKEMDK